MYQILQNNATINTHSRFIESYWRLRVFLKREGMEEEKPATNDSDNRTREWIESKFQNEVPAQKPPVIVRFHTGYSVPLKTLLIDLIRLRIDSEVSDQTSVYARAWQIRTRGFYSGKSRVSLYFAEKRFFPRGRKRKSNECPFSCGFHSHEEFNISFSPTNSSFRGDGRDSSEIRSLCNFVHSDNSETSRTRTRVQKKYYLRHQKSMLNN